ncbi:MAG: OadG family protein [Oscillospiraceae bacterium]|jgi:Na+-transporting methylmalonyl-CoA/oxaloacetate decarboxylase gamma subunit|nr:OadG family protein [Oscillospiraceae bacterium]
MLLLAVARTTEQLTEISLSEGLLISVVGMSVVFVALTSIMALTKLQSAIILSLQNKRGQAAPATEPAPAAPAAVPAIVPAAAPASAPGAVALVGVEDKIAAMIMAIVADEMKTPLHELRFISIKEV